MSSLAHLTDRHLPTDLTLDVFNACVIQPALTLLPAAMRGQRATAMLLAIALQESALAARRQYENGPARGYWQFERGGGVVGVLLHDATRLHAQRLCRLWHVPPTPQSVWEAITYHDQLACGFARLLLWTDPKALPPRGDPAPGWQMYLRQWRPGKPHPELWPACYDAAWTFVDGAGVAAGAETAGTPATRALDAIRVRSRA